MGTEWKEEAVMRGLPRGYGKPSIVKYDAFLAGGRGGGGGGALLTTILKKSEARKDIGIVGERREEADQQEEA